MRSTLKKAGNMTISLSEFTSLQDVAQYIKNTPDVSLFNLRKIKSSHKDSEDWSGTSNFEEALDLLKTGWTDKSKELEEKLNKKLNKEPTQVMRQKSVYDVVGGNASVPRYLQGVPTNMIRQVRTPVKQKVVTVNYSIAFSSGVSAAEITNRAVDCLSYVKHLEDTGVRVNLNVIWVVNEYTDYVGFIVPIKKSTERFSISKAAFCLCHPSMLRRIGFALMEKEKNLLDMKYGNKFPYGYGHPVNKKVDLSKILPDMEVYNAI